MLILSLYPACGYTQPPTAYNLADLYDFNVKTVYALYQAKNKHVWIGSDQGLFEFNGTDFTKYLNIDYQTEYTNIQEDREGRIWCNNFSGQLFCVEGRDLKLFKDVSEYVYTGVMSYMYTAAYFPRIYIGTNYGYIIADFYDRDNSTHFQTSHQDKKGYKILSNKDTVYSDNIRLIRPYKNGIIYRGELMTINLLQESRNIEILFPIDKKPGGGYFMFLHDDKVLFLYRSSDDNKLKIHCYQNGITQTRKYHDLPKPNPSAIYYHQETNQYWLGTVDGIFVMNETLQFIPRKFPLLKGVSVSGIMRDHEGNYWVATLRHGIYIIPSLTIQTINNRNSVLVRNELIGLEKIDSQHLLLADNSGSLYQYHLLENKLELMHTIGVDPASMSYHPIKKQLYFHDLDQYYDLKTRKLVASNLQFIKAGTAIDSVHFLLSQAGMAVITNFETAENKLPMDTLWQKRYAIFRDLGPPNRLLLRKKRSQLNTFCKATRTLYVNYSDGLFSYKDAVEQPVFYNNLPLLVTALQPARKQGIWAADTEGRLYYVLEHAANVTEEFNTEIKHIRQHDSLLFLGTNEGLIKYNLHNRQKEIINMLDGLPSNKITGMAIANDTVFVATLKGLAKVPLAYTYKNGVAPEISLTKMTVNGKLTEKESALTLEPGENNLSFFFNAYALRSQKTFTYAYRMLGVDSTWNITRNQNVSFAALAPGQYTFQLKAVNEDGIESRQIEQVKFMINTPFYQQWWFYVLISAGSIALVSYLYTYRIRTLKKQNELQQRQKALEKKLAASAITTLKAQMNPHFMFNAMNSIQSLILKGQRDEAYDYLTKFSTLIRENLNMSEKNFVYCSEELHLITTYLELEKLRFRTGFEYTVKGMENTDDIKIPAMIIQPFIENAIKHGLLHKSGTKRLTIEFKQNEVLQCIITDNGIGRTASEAINRNRKERHESFATDTIEKRFALLGEYYDMELGFHYIDLEENGSPSGTRVIIKIPYLRGDE